jgi:hypothetical protein
MFQHMTIPAKQFKVGLVHVFLVAILVMNNQNFRFDTPAATLALTDQKDSPFGRHAQSSTRQRAKIISKNFARRLPYGLVAPITIYFNRSLVTHGLVVTRPGTIFGRCFSELNNAKLAAANYTRDSDSFVLVVPLPKTLPRAKFEFLFPVAWDINRLRTFKTGYQEAHLCRSQKRVKRSWGT